MENRKIKKELPFEENFLNGFYERTFSKDLSENELKWHWDEEDRYVICENNTDWKFQFDNQLPIEIKRNEPIFIKKGEYHRIIKGNNDLKLKIKKIK